MERWLICVALTVATSGCSTVLALTGNGSPPPGSPQRSGAASSPAASERKEAACTGSERRQDAEAVGCCEQGVAAWCVATGSQRTRAASERVRLLSRACELNELQACSLLGMVDDLVDTDPEQARVGLHKACSAGLQDTCDRAGLLMAQEKLGAASPAEEVALAQLVCEAGQRAKQVLKVHHYACVVYGNALWDGRAIAEDRSTALRVLSTSCDDPLVPIAMQADCHVRIARAYRDGGATPQDPQEASAHFARACRLSETAESCLEYAQTCDDALFGYERDGDHETQCYEPACRAGSATACETMGNYFQGWDQWEKAAKAYGAAVALGAESARPRLDEVVAKLGRQREHDRVRAAASVDGLLAQCRSNRSKVEQARVALFSARSRVDRAGMEQAAAALKELEGPWSRTLSELQSAIAVASNGSADERVRMLLVVDEQCNCKPTRTGHCR